MDSPLLMLAFNVAAALAGTAFLSLVFKTLARTVSIVAWSKATREITRAAMLVEQLRERDPTRMMIALMVRQFSIYLVLSLLTTGAVIASLATRGSQFDLWFPVSMALIALLFQKTHERYARASELLQLRNPGITAIAARVRTFYLAMNGEQQAALDQRLHQLQAEFGTLGGPPRASAAQTPSAEVPTAA